MGLDVAAAERAASGVTVTHYNRKGVGIFPRLAVVTDVYLEPERSCAVYRGRAQNGGAATVHNHRRDGGALYGPVLNMVLVSEITARCPAGVGARGEAEGRLAASY